MTVSSTDLIHHGYVPPAGFGAPQPGVFKASTVFFPNVAAMRHFEWKDKTAYTYGLHGTPTSYTLEERLCTLEGGQQCLLVPSGLAAIATVSLALLKTGDEVLIPDNAYGPSKALAEAELRHWGISHQFYDALNPQDLAGKIGPNTRLVWLEAAGSVTLEFPDLIEQVRICQAAKVLCALDNTWGAGLAFAPFDLLPGAAQPLAVDISVHALTKYPSGGGDVLMGSVITRDPGLHMRLKLCHMRLGLGVAANDVEAVLRGLPSIQLRYTAHDQATRTLAQWCQTRPEFAQVLHPALANSPGHAHWLQVCQGDLGRAAGLLSVMFKPEYSQAQVDAFCDALALFEIGYSWGGPVSLVVPYDLASMRPSWPAHLARGTLVRLSIGLEAVEDLQADLAQALRRLV
ncbi:PLP-dependent transferase [Rhodoferax fermentans]|uniref:Cystathionine beta-lyase n=1 Tax=Rhodoferax fermentans TaxID=28066 RepID=A0A1T1AUK4_RHOFE|nr:PLP-dependent transferase [Rhodoferax fermentans]MBK1682953.1 cystathionine beta-lyase [Rhodoferax fermentans]OOV07796.1 cystathionine beta-lyase [Rhodoferax fermentans]